MDALSGSSCQAALDAREAAFSSVGGLCVAVVFVAVYWLIASRRNVVRFPRGAAGTATASLLAIATVFAAGTGVAAGQFLADVGHSCPSPLDGLFPELSGAARIIAVLVVALLCSAPLVGAGLVAALAMTVRTGARFTAGAGCVVGIATCVIALVVMRSLHGMDVVTAVVLAAGGVGAAISCPVTFFRYGRHPELG